MRRNQLRFPAAVNVSGHMTHATDVSATAASCDDDVILRPARRAIRRDVGPRRRRADQNWTSTSSCDVTACDVDSPVASAAARSSELTDDKRRPGVPPGVPPGVSPGDVSPGVFDVFLSLFPSSITNSLQPTKSVADHQLCNYTLKKITDIPSCYANIVRLYFLGRNVTYGLGNQKLVYFQTSPRGLHVYIAKPRNSLTANTAFSDTKTMSVIKLTFFLQLLFN